MPATPEVGGILCFVGRVEVDGEVEPHEHGHADGDVGIAGEIGIDLEGIDYEGGEVLEGSVEQGIFEDPIDKADGQIIAKDYFFNQTIANPKDRYTKLAVGKEEWLVKLWNELVGTQDGSCYKLREESGVEAEVEDVGDVVNFALVDIDDVADVLESEEGDADGEEYLDGNAVFGAEGGVENVSEEVGVFEEAEYTEIDHYTYGTQGFAFGIGQRLVHADAKNPSQEGGKDE